MIHINDLKNGMTIEHDNNIFLVLEFQHVKPGKGPAFVKTKLKNLRTGAIIENTFITSIKFKRANIVKQYVQYLYDGGNNLVFMNMDTYEQLEIKKEDVEEYIDLLIENINLYVVSYEGEILDLELPDKIEMKVIKAEPGTKGNTATSATKDITLETGLVVKAPLFIEEGEIIIISTKDKKYSSRK